MRLRRTGDMLLAAGILVFVAAVVTLVWTGHTALRYSADNDNTLSLWAICLTVLGGLAVARLVPPKPDDGLLPGDPRTTRQAWWLFTLGLVFAVGFYLSPGGDLWFLGLKLALLLAVPLSFRLVSWREWYRVDTRGRWLRPLPAMLVFLTLFTLFGHSYTGARPDLIALIAVFTLNAMLEEIFYRVWLQTRLEKSYGRWPAIALSSLVFAVWHVTIHGGNGFGIDLAAAVVHIGGYGIFLGYLWSRYRNPWLLFVVHGIINAPIPMLAALW
ncbi:CPBP family intramembrane glutamic endopeptidase [Nocardia sp. NPDC006044]|uniref:CPBP family intramembrane glutamic endopeptidase n=1 Tax=Nocardia sp. NPDC006044 TaxID=3364306 RepID=UPI003681FDBF